MSDFTYGAAASTGRPQFRGLVAETGSFLRGMMRARATRRLLADMDDRQLADIGIGRGDALDEAWRPMWDLTPRRR